MLSNVERTSLSVFPETLEDLELIKEKTGANKKWIIRILVKHELERITKGKRSSVDALEVVVR